MRIENLCFYVVKINTHQQNNYKFQNTTDKRLSQTPFTFAV